MSASEKKREMLERGIAANKSELGVWVYLVKGHKKIIPPEHKGEVKANIKALKYCIKVLEEKLKEAGEMSIYKEQFNQILEKLVKLTEYWRKTAETEKNDDASGVWLDCADDVENIVEDMADQK